MTYRTGRAVLVLVLMLAGGLPQARAADPSGATNVAAGAAVAATESYPAAKPGSYVDPVGTKHVYLVQEPAAVTGRTNLLIYLHGAAGLEEQGMDSVWTSHTFARLRELMARWGWIYVCPRDYEFRSLLWHLRERYRPGAVYLAGASAGGREAFREARENPGDYAGLLLLCPAEPFPESAAKDVDAFTMPIWIATGEKDGFITVFSRLVSQNLARAGKRHRYLELPGGDHGTPLAKADWEKSLQFLLAPP